MQETPRVAQPALKRGFAEADVLHAYEHAIRFTVGTNDKDIAVGPTRSGEMLEVGFIEGDDEVVIVHAMRARAKFLPNKKKR